MDQHMEMLKNKNVSERLANELKRFETEEEPILFAVIGDLSLNCSYCETMLAITKNRTIVIDSSLEGGAAVYPHADVEKAVVKRMYGNAVLKYTVKGKALSVFRFTYSVAALCDTAAVFVEHMHDGGDLAEELDVVAAMYERFCAPGRSAFTANPKRKWRESSINTSSRRSRFWYCACFYPSFRRAPCCSRRI